MRDQTTTCFCGKPGIRLGLVPFDRDERLIETERILSLLMESRGADYSYLDLKDGFYFEWMTDDVNYDLMPSGLFPFIAQAQNADLAGGQKTASGSEVGSANFSAPMACSYGHSPTTLARGSPR